MRASQLFLECMKEKPWNVRSSFSLNTGKGKYGGRVIYPLNCSFPKKICSAVKGNRLQEYSWSEGKLSLW